MHLLNTGVIIMTNAAVGSTSFVMKRKSGSYDVRQTFLAFFWPCEEEDAATRLLLQHTIFRRAPCHTRGD